MKKTIIKTEKAPAAVGPYSQAVNVNGTVYFSGQIPLSPSTGEVVEGGIEAQTRQVLENLAAVLEEAGCNFETVIKTTVFLTDMGDFPVVNGIYAEYFKADPPARACVEVSKLPKGVNVEIEAIAFVA